MRAQSPLLGAGAAPPAAALPKHAPSQRRILEFNHLLASSACHVCQCLAASEIFSSAPSMQSTLALLAMLLGCTSALASVKQQLICTPLYKVKSCAAQQRDTAIEVRNSANTAHCNCNCYCAHFK